MRILITGASGFIGTNLLSAVKSAGADVLNADISPPRDQKQTPYWRKVDICNRDELRVAFLDFQPDHVVHLAAKTTIEKRSDVQQYRENTDGVRNVVEVCSELLQHGRVIFASSMLVNEVGYQPHDLFDYNPSTPYGKSKVIGERIVLDEGGSLNDLCIVRPTSIWGEWFDKPYRSFFDYVIAERFFHPGTRACSKTAGYVGNTVQQIWCLLRADRASVNRQIYYLGDSPPLNISTWATEIAHQAGVEAPRRLPYAVFRAAAMLGDALERRDRNFPMTSFRLKNMITDNVIDLGPLQRLCGVPTFSVKEGISRTLGWMRHGRIIDVTLATLPEPQSMTSLR